MCDNMLYELAEEAKREISKYSDDYEIYLENSELLQLDSQKDLLSHQIWVKLQKLVKMLI